MPRVVRPLKPAPPVAPIAVRPPTGLKTAGRRLWNQVAPLPWVGASDAMSLRSLCEMADLAESLMADVKERGPSYRGPVPLVREPKPGGPARGREGPGRAHGVVRADPCERGSWALPSRSRRPSSTSSPSVTRPGWVSLRLGDESPHRCE